MIRTLRKYISYFPPDKIRNFCIIAHIDHGKSTLADRLLQITKTISCFQHPQYLDKLKVQQQRGITVKAQAVSMIHTYNNQQYLINFIDTPGHVDFNYQVKRSMRSCQGGLLVVDSTQGLQAQTYANMQLAKQQKLKVILVVNKIDMISASPQQTALHASITFNLDLEKVHYVSAKTGKNVPALLDAVITQIPPPENNTDKKLKLFLINSWYQKSKGVICLVQVKSGILKPGIQVTSCAFHKSYTVFQVGILNPQMKPQNQLTVGQIGYVITNIKNIKQSRIGDTYYMKNQPVQPELGFQPAKSMVYTGIYPMQPNKILQLEKAIYKLVLTDPAVELRKQSCAALGNGFRCGFLGVLHMEIFRQRLEDEYNMQVILTAPSIPYKCYLKNGKELIMQNAYQSPQKSQVNYYEQPMVKAKILYPTQCKKEIKGLCQKKRAKFINEYQINVDMQIVYYRMPLQQIINNFIQQIKQITSGFGSIDYDLDGYQKVQIEKLVICVMGQPVDALTFMVHKTKAYQFGKKLCKKLKQTLPTQLFVVKIQAKLGSKIIAKQEISYLKKHVTARCYGGDYSRKKKIIERYKQGKKKLRAFGKVEISKNTLFSVLK